MIHRLGKEINHPDSIYYWAYKNNIPVYCPALTDGSLGDMLYFHTFKNPGLVLDIIADIRCMNDEAMKAPPRKTGVIILGGGMSQSASTVSMLLQYWPSVTWIDAYHITCRALALQHLVLCPLCVPSWHGFLQDSQNTTSAMRI